MVKTSSENEIDWDNLYPQLYSFAHRLLSAKSWSRGQADSYVAGKQTHDYVADAIEKYLTHPEIFDPARGELPQFLKYNLIRSLISNDVRCKENRLSTDLSVIRDSEMNTKAYPDALAPAVNEFFDDDIDYHTIVSSMEDAVEGDTIAKDILLGLVSGLKRAEIIQEFKLSTKDFDNGMRRLKTIQKDIAKRFNQYPSKP